MGRNATYMQQQPCCVFPDETSPYPYEPRVFWDGFAPTLSNITSTTLPPTTISIGTPTRGADWLNPEFCTKPRIVPQQSDPEERFWAYSAGKHQNWALPSVQRGSLPVFGEQVPIKWYAEHVRTRDMTTRSAETLKSYAGHTFSNKVKVSSPNADFEPSYLDSNRPIQRVDSLKESWNQCTKGMDAAISMCADIRNMLSILVERFAPKPLASAQEGEQTDEGLAAQQQTDMTLSETKEQQYNSGYPCNQAWEQGNRCVEQAVEVMEESVQNVVQCDGTNTTFSSMETDPRQAMILDGSIGIHKVTVLIDSNATDNCISSHVIQEVGLTITNTEECKENSAVGSTHANQVICPKVKLKLANYRVKTDFLLLPLEYVDVILGRPWWQSLGVVKMDVELQKIEFKQSERKVRLFGRPLHNTEPSFQGILQGRKAKERTCPESRQKPSNLIIKRTAKENHHSVQGLAEFYEAFFEFDLEDKIIFRGDGNDAIPHLGPDFGRRPAAPKDHCPSSHNSASSDSSSTELKAPKGHLTEHLAAHLSTWQLTRAHGSSLKLRGAKGSLGAAHTSSTQLSLAPSSSCHHLAQISPRMSYNLIMGSSI